MAFKIAQFLIISSIVLTTNPNMVKAVSDTELEELEEQYAKTSFNWGLLMVQPV